MASAKGEDLLVMLTNKKDSKKRDIISSKLLLLLYFVYHIYINFPIKMRPSPIIQMIEQD